MDFGLAPGQRGATPTFSIGTVSTSTVTSVSFNAASTATNKIMDFGLVPGITPTLSIGTVSGSTDTTLAPAVSMTAHPTIVNEKVINFKLLNGNTPAFSIGSVSSTTTTPSVSFSAASTATNKILDFGFPKGDPGNRAY